MKTSEKKAAGNPVNDALKLPLADAFENDLTALLEAADGANVVAITMVDLDHFMEVNTRYGHEVGDRVLIETGEYFRAGIPSGSRLYRYGGDSFAIVWGEGIEREEAFLRTEQLRAGYPVVMPDDAKRTISAGVAAAPEDGTRYTELVRKADGAMMRAKMGERNRVCLAREEKMATKTTHYTAEQLQRLSRLSKKEGIGEAVLLREALDMLLKKYDA